MLHSYTECRKRARNLLATAGLLVYVFVDRNEQEIGLGIRKSGILREDVFVVTKLVWDDHGYERCKMSFTDSLNR